MRVLRRLLGIDSDEAAVRLVSVIDLKQGDRVRLLGQIYEAVQIERTFANERRVVLHQIGGSNRLELDELEYPFAVFELAFASDGSRL
ncbi:MAG TPA: hypothetical protein VE172_08075 [Stackebrandtia sp.]|uniref:hypothetical protein n=1 Tax=Stackebrandtia sp. TaxID=2023065 RepID=UPI002D52BC0B|nr:hypothetical protein [Stackebrandtia sp.]HZE38755.1 hypothetical protein [Stackebrandtia sp.]